MKTIRLYGTLAVKFGREFVLDVKNAAEAVRALCVIAPGFKEHLNTYSEPGYFVRAGNDVLSAEELANPVSDKEVIRIMPAIVGAGGKFGQIIVGALLIVAAFYMPGASTVLYGAGQSAITVGSIMFSVGVSLVLGGIAQLLYSAPKSTSSEKPDNQPSYAFNGPVNTTQQGNNVPVCYGEMIVGSQVISAGLYVEDIAI